MRAVVSGISPPATGNATYSWSTSLSTAMGVDCNKQSTAKPCTTTSTIICQQATTKPYLIGRVFADTSNNRWCMCASNGMSLPTYATGSNVLYLQSTSAAVWSSSLPRKPVNGFDGTLSVCRGWYGTELLPGWTDGKVCYVEYSGKGRTLSIFEWLSL